MSAGLADLGEKLRRVLHGNAAPEDRIAALQDALDLMAVVAGKKPIALIGCGYAGSDWLDVIADLALAQGLGVRRGGMPWSVAEEIDTLPDWYREPMLDSWAAADLLTVGADALLAQFEPDGPTMLGATDAAKLLGYPSCCVIDHHARRHFYHATAIELIRANYKGEAEQRRFAASELPPPLRDASDGLRLAEALRAPQAPFTSLGMCAECHAQFPDSPAGRMSTLYRALAETSGLAALFVPPARSGTAEA